MPVADVAGRLVPGRELFARQEHEVELSDIVGIAAGAIAAAVAGPDEPGLPEIEAAEEQGRAFRHDDRVEGA